MSTTRAIEMNFKNADGSYDVVYPSSLIPVTCVTNGTVHALSNMPASSGVVQCLFTADVGFTAGDTFTVNGTAYTVLTSSGEAARTKLFVANNLVTVVVDITNKKIYVTQALMPTYSDVGAVPTSRTVNGKALSGNISLGAGDVGAVPATRTVNGKALSGDISLGYSDVGAVPTSRTVNGKALSGNISLGAGDVGARPNSWVPAANDIVNQVYPVGSIYMSMASTNPGYLFGGTWVQLSDRFLLGAGSTAAGNVGGEAQHQLTQSELPVVNGSIELHNKPSGTELNKTSGVFSVADPISQFGLFNSFGDYAASYATLNIAFGGNVSHNNMPPYMAVYMWRRTA